MKRLVILSGVVMMLSAACTTTERNNKTTEIKQSPREKVQKVDKETLIIFYDAKIGDKNLLKAVNEYNAEIIYKYENINGMAIKIPKNRTLEEAISFFENVKGVISVEKNEIMTLQRLGAE